MVSKKKSKSGKNPRKKSRDTDSRKKKHAGRASNSSIIVGIGASAGGLEAFQSFFSNMPPDSSMSFVLIQHLSPDHKSMLADLVGKATPMPVLEAQDGMPIAANTVYVIPPDATLTLKERRLRVSKPAPPRERRRPIDTFFCSLAEEQEENAICIVLSGTGSDGTLGLTTIKEHGGLTFAQAESDHTAKSGMPQSATATGLVDEVMPVADMPAKLLDYQSHLRKVAGRKSDGARIDAADHLTKISAILRARVGHDFSKYKEKTLVRRIQRRMQVLQIDTVQNYVARLREDPHQVELLFRELLIGVTQFFRDPEAFAALAVTAISKILEKANAGGTIRVWVPGCATGEEVYSIAILLKEALNGREAVPSVQIFGTDIDDSAVAVARAGRYRKTTGVSAERLTRWFAEDGEEFSPIKAIREMCVFSTHSVVKDPPFSKLDLISCRNLLIYMDADLQDRILQTFHYALSPDGILFLGSAEGVTRQSKRFGTLDKKHRIYQRRAADIALPDIASSPSFPVPRHPTAASPTLHDNDRLGRSAKRIADKYSPVYLVIDECNEIVRFCGGEVGQYLEPFPGAPTFKLLDILRKPLRAIVRSALQKARASKEPVTQEEVTLRINGLAQSITVIVEPLVERSGASNHCVLVLQNSRKQSAWRNGEAPSQDVNLRGLEHELRTTKTQLQSTIDDLETANEEMKSATEEYQSVNEELRSSNEELETSKEEMQSMNEELQTINIEMAHKNDALMRANSDLKNLLDSTEIATIFLDNDLRIKGFTPGMADIFRLRDSDRGRPITDIASTLCYAGLPDDAQTVLRKLSVIEEEVQLKDSRTTFIMNIRPYRTVDNVIDGVVITFVDITERRRAQDQRAALTQELNHRVKNALATVQSIASQTFRYAATPEEFQHTFAARLMALAKTHDILTQNNWERAPLRELLKAELEPYGGSESSRFSLNGDDVRLTSQMALAFGLVFHELTTNAAKHGALSVPNGRVEIDWKVDDDSRRLHLQWMESGGPRVEKPARRGMGSRVIESGLMHEFGGEARIAFDRSGIRCSIDVPLPRPRGHLISTRAK